MPNPTNNARPDARAELLAAIEERTYTAETRCDCVDANGNAWPDCTCDAGTRRREVPYDFPALLDAALSQAREQAIAEIEAKVLPECSALRSQLSYLEGKWAAALAEARAAQKREDAAIVMAIDDTMPISRKGYAAAILRGTDRDAATGKADDQTYSREFVEAADRLLRCGAEEDNHDDPNHPS